MTVAELCIAMFKLILQGKGNYRIYAWQKGWVSGHFKPSEDDNIKKRVVMW